MYNFAKLNWIKLEGLSEGLEIMAVMQKQETCFQVIWLVDMLPQYHPGYAPKVQ